MKKMLVALAIMASVGILSADNVRITGTIYESQGGGSVVQASGMGYVYLMGVYGTKGEFVSVSFVPKGIHTLQNGAKIPAYAKPKKNANVSVK